MAFAKGFTKESCTDIFKCCSADTWYIAQDVFLAALASATNDTSIQSLHQYADGQDANQMKAA